jgi:hypothetical protein
MCVFFVQDEKKNNNKKNYLENRISLASASKRGLISSGGITLSENKCCY